ncbi:hypothetical protein CASFOL_042786 [Castilleja foliolosa]|uniref:Uncharacterized protein n=1 Tax=Castilleja foliolosa TaxID=1961234 RepID=A0ABD3B7Q7_9LAMI
MDCSAKIQKFVEDQLIDKTVLFEVVETPTKLLKRLNHYTRLSFDEDIFDLYKEKYPAIKKDSTTDDTETLVMILKLSTFFLFRLHGQNYHLIGSLLPTEGQQPKFAQLYIHDTTNEIRNRTILLAYDKDNNLQEDIVSDLKLMLDEHNVLVQSFRMAREKINECEGTKVSLKLIIRRGPEVRNYNLPEVSEVAAFDRNRNRKAFVFH